MKIEELVKTKKWKNSIGFLHLVTLLFFIISIFLCLMLVANAIVTFVLSFGGLAFLIKVVFLPTGILILLSYIAIDFDERFK